MQKKKKQKRWREIVVHSEMKTYFSFMVFC